MSNDKIAQAPGADNTEPETYTLTADQLRSLAGGRWGCVSGVATSPLAEIVAGAADDVRFVSAAMHASEDDMRREDVETAMLRVADRLQTVASLMGRGES